MNHARRALKTWKHTLVAISCSCEARIDAQLSEEQCSQSKFARRVQASANFKCRRSRRKGDGGLLRGRR
jgi:hypothetical protein